MKPRLFGCEPMPVVRNVSMKDYGLLPRNSSLIAFKVIGDILFISDITVCAKGPKPDALFLHLLGALQLYPHPGYLMKRIGIIHPAGNL
jgi:hypothetical protein